MEKEIEKLRDFFRDQKKSTSSSGKIWEKNRKFLESVIYTFKVWLEALVQANEGKKFVEHLKLYLKKFIDTEKYPIRTKKDRIEMYDQKRFLL